VHFLLIPHFQLAHSFTGLLLCQISRVLSLTDRVIGRGQAVLHAVQIGPLLFDGGFQVREVLLIEVMLFLLFVLEVLKSGELVGERGDLQLFHVQLSLSILEEELERGKLGF